MPWLVSIAVVILFWVFVFEVLVHHDSIEDWIEGRDRLERLFDWVVGQFMAICVVIMFGTFFGFWVVITKWILFGP